MAVNLDPAKETLNRYGLLRPRFLAVAGAVVLVLAFVFLRGGGGTEEDMFITVEASRGDIFFNIASTGILQAVITVQVGSQVSGRVQELHADFNSVVKKGQILALIDPASFEAQMARSRAAVSMTKANVKNAEATLVNRGAELESSRANQTAAQVARKDAKSGMERNRGLFEADLVSERVLEQAQAAHEGAIARAEQAAAQVKQVQAGIRSAAAQLEQAQASVQQAIAELQVTEVNLKYTKIIAPIDGVVIERNVDIGQTVAASFQAPILFLIANDLTRMQVIAQVDEADIGALSENAEVEFTVDAFPQKTFQGLISEIRLSSLLPGTTTAATTTGGGSSNVVVYNVIIDVENRDLTLRPSMTANVTFTVSKEEDVVKIANAALRYRPSNRDPSQENVVLASSRPQSDGPGAGAHAGNRPGGPDRGGQGQRGRGREEGMRPNRDGEETSQPKYALRAAAERYGIRPGVKIHFPKAGIVNRNRRAVVWTLEEDGSLKSHSIRLGITNGRETAVLEGDLSEGDLIITGEYLSEEERAAGPRSPFSGPFGRRGGGNRSGRSRTGGTRR